MLCPKCGLKNSKRAKFCNECGTSLRVLSLDENAFSSNDFESLPAEPVEQVLEPDYQASAKSSSLDLPSIHDLSPERQGINELFETNARSTDARETFISSKVPYAAKFHDNLQDRDTSGFDEYLIDYSPLEAMWKTGDTMEMPRVEGKTAERKEFRAPDQQEKPKRGKVIILIAILLVVAAILTTAGLTYQMEIWGGKSLPDVSGMGQEEATRLLESRGFTVKAMHVKSDEEEASVLLMDPSAGKRLSAGSEVVLQIATARIIPEIVGRLLPEAEEALKQEGFERIEYVKVKSDEAENTILSIDPQAGGKANAATLITVTVAEPYIVPEVAGQDVASASEAVQGAGFVPEITYVYSDQEEGTVVQTDPVAGTKLTSGSTVIIQVAKSRASELIAVTQEYLTNQGSINIGGASYKILSVDGVSYVEGNTTTATITIEVPVVDVLDGQVLSTTQRQRTLTFTWDDDNTLVSYT